MRRLTLGLLTVALLALLGGAAALFWVGGTTEGARWFLKSLSRAGGPQVSARTIDGRLFGRLRLGGVRISLPQQELELERLDLAWKPMLLLAGTIGIRELTLSGLRIQDNGPADNKPPDLLWPRVPGFGSLFDGRIAHLRVDGFSYRHLDQPPLILTRISGTLAWQDQLLSLSDLSLLSPSGSVSGAVEAGFQRPSLKSDLSVSLTRPLAGIGRFSLRTRFLPGRAAEQTAGAFTLIGSGKQRLELAGELGMTRTGFNLRRLHLTAEDRKGTLSGEGTLSLATRTPQMTLRIRGEDLNLAPELGLPTDLSGTLRVSGTMESYRGTLSLANRGKGWQKASISGAFRGNATGVKLAPLNGALLDGTVGGQLEIGWIKELWIAGALSGRKLNPARIDPDWSGVANFDLAANLAWPASGAVAGKVSANLLESRLHGQALTGELQADVSGEYLSISRLILRGKGFDLRASGQLDRRLELSARVADLSRLVPGTAGELQARGWVRRQGKRLEGELNGHGSNLASDGVRIGGLELAARLKEGAGYPLRVSATLRKPRYDRYQVEKATLTADGTLLNHTLDLGLNSAQAEAHLSLSGGYSRGSWKGRILTFDGRDRVAPWNLVSQSGLDIAAGRVSLSPLVIAGAAQERIELEALLTRNPAGGSIRASWQRLNLARANQWQKEIRLSGTSSGNIRWSGGTGRQPNLSGSVAAQGTVTTGDHSVTVQAGQATFEGSGRGLKAGIELRTLEGGRLKGTFSSTLPAGPAIPEQGDLAAEWSGFDLALLRPWLPDDLSLEGRLAGRATGKLRPGKRFDLDGAVDLSAGKIHRESPQGVIDLSLRSATATWSWQDETLAVGYALALAEYGQARGSFRLPLAARFPLALDPGGSVQGTLTGQAREKGLLSALFPGMVQESRGELDANLRVSGRWDDPNLAGELALARAGAYLPTAGIQVKDVQLVAKLERNLISIESFRASSGPGHLEGKARLRLKGWQVTGYSGNIGGERFQTINFPEFQLQSTPKLTFEGTPEKLVLRGEVLLPELNIIGPQSSKVIAPSSDVVLEGKGKTRPVAKTSKLALDARIRLLLGDQVHVKVEGIDAQLGGSMDLAFRNLNQITSTGQIRVIKGRYRTYGVNLDIARGRLFYAGGSLSQPTLDFLALRTIGDIKAGVTVGGTLQAPVTKLYSEPAMPDVDILAYIVLGHPLGSSGQQAGLLAQAAGVLLSSSQSESLLDQIRSRLGLSTLEIKSGVGTTSNPMGFKPMTVTPPGTIPATQTAGITQTMMMVGKYLTPELYVSYGRSLFTGSNLFLLRYDIYKQWQIETQAGSESGADLYYKIEFK